MPRCSRDRLRQSDARAANISYEFRSSSPDPPAEAAKQKTRDSQSWAGETRDRGGARGDVVVTGLRGEPSGFHVIKIAGRPKENNSTNGCGSPPRRYRAPIRLDRQGWVLRPNRPRSYRPWHTACCSMAWLIGFILTIVSSISTPRNWI